MFSFPFHIWDVILPIDELIFFKIVKTTNQTTINIQKPYPNRFSWTYMVRPGERAVRHLVAEMLGRGDGNVRVGNGSLSLYVSCVRKGIRFRYMNIIEHILT